MRIERLRADYPEFDIRVDYNQGLAPTNALRQLRDIESLDVTFIEQPVPARNYRQMQDLAAALETPLLADCLWVGGWPNRNNTEWPGGRQRMQSNGPGSWNSGMGRFAMTRHNVNKVNVAFADGHVKTLLPSQLWMLRWHKDSNPVEVSIGWE